MMHKVLIGGSDPIRVEEVRASNVKRFLTIAHVAQIVGVSTRTVRRWVKCGDLVTHRFGGLVRVAESDLNAFIASHRRF